MKLTNPNNGFFRLEVDGVVLLGDVWLTDGIYDGGWLTFPPLQDREKHLQGATHVYVSHIHEDHFDLHALARLPKTTRLLIPRVYAYQVMVAKLRALGFENITLLESHVPFEIAPGVDVELVPPMNAYGQQVEMYPVAREENLPSIAIDTGLLVHTAKGRLLFLGDNFPYDLKASGLQLDRLKDLELLAFPYNGLASDFPLCYNDLSPEQILEILEPIESKRQQSLLAFFEAVKPRRLMPYSSDFFVAGPQARRFAQICTRWWANRRQTAEYFRKRTGIEAVYLFEQDWLQWAPEFRWEKKPDPRISVEAFALTAFSRSSLTTVMFPPVATPAEIEGPLHQAAAHLFSSMDRFRLQSDWILGLRLADFSQHPTLYLDLKRREITAQVTTRRKRLVCELHSGYLLSLLRGKSHWNNAQLSFQLKWFRDPNVYDDGLYKALNFFHMPRERSANSELDRSDPKSLAGLPTTV